MLKKASVPTCCCEWGSKIENGSGKRSLKVKDKKSLKRKKILLIHSPSGNSKMPVSCSSTSFASPRQVHYVVSPPIPLNPLSQARESYLVEKEKNAQSPSLSLSTHPKIEASYLGEDDLQQPLQYRSEGNLLSTMKTTGSQENQQIQVKRAVSYVDSDEE